VVAGLVTLAAFLFVSEYWYCFFFCNFDQGFPAPGELYSPTGLFAHPGVRNVASGFWLMLGGLVLVLGGDLILLAGARQRRDRAKHAE
jgi:hypothetical protein